MSANIFIKKNRIPKEETLAIHIAHFLKAKKLIYRFDLAADIKLTQGQAAKHKKLQMKERGYPDLFIAEPKNGYAGLYIELKKDKSEVFLKDGITYKKAAKKVKNKRGVVIEEYDHIQEQLKMHDKLRAKGYKVVFGFGLKDTIEKIEEYLSEQF